MGDTFFLLLWWNVNNVLCFSKTEIKLQAILEKEKKLQQEAFWLETVTFGKNLRDDKWFNLFDIKAAMDKILLMAMENDIDNETVAQWKKDVVLVQVLMEGLKNKPHQEAIRTLKIKFGGSRGLDDDSRRMVNRIMRDSQRVQNIDSFPHQTWQPNPSMGFPFQPFPFPGVGAPNPGTNMGFDGTCFLCGQHGHRSRDCAMNGARTFGNRGSGRRGGMRGRRASRSGR